MKLVPDGRHTVFCLLLGEALENKLINEPLSGERGIVEITLRFLGSLLVPVCAAVIYAVSSFFGRKPFVFELVNQTGTGEGCVIEIA